MPICVARYTLHIPPSPRRSSILYLSERLFPTSAAAFPRRLFPHLLHWTSSADTSEPQRGQVFISFLSSTHPHTESAGPFLLWLVPFDQYAYRILRYPATLFAARHTSDPADYMNSVRLYFLILE